MNYENAVSNIRKELKHYIQSNNIKSLILGVSGGIDSALCAALAKPVCDELKISLIGVSLPEESNKIDEIERAKNIMINFCSDFEQKFIDNEFNYLNNGICQNVNINPDLRKEKMRKGNIKARIRMIYLYNLASINNGMVLSTDNYTEYLLGFWTLCGDVGDYGMIQKMWKTEVYEMTEWLIKNELVNNKTKGDSLQHCIDCMATDGLGVTDMGDLGQILPEWEGNSRDGYKKVDEILINYYFTVPLNEYLDHPVIKRHIASQFKRNWPIVIEREKIVKFK